jgi:aspartyl-tRNA synthetase
MNQSTTRSMVKRWEIAQISEEQLGARVLLRGRVHVSRATGAKMLFLTLRQCTSTIQAVLTVDDAVVSKQMLKFASAITSESLVLVEAMVLKAPEPIKSCSVRDFELKIEKVSACHSHALNSIFTSFFILMLVAPEPTKSWRFRTWCLRRCSFISFIFFCEFELIFIRSIKIL